MKIPVHPPNIETLFKKLSAAERVGYLLPDELLVKKVNNEYVHWDKLRHLQPPKGMTSEAWWWNVKIARKLLYKKLSFKDKHNGPFHLATPDIVLKQLHILDRQLASSIQSESQLLNPHIKEVYLIRSLMEEAITSSQLEGASTTHNVAKEMLRTNRKPRDISEQMIYNNYQAMQFINEIKAERLTIKIILELHRILTKDTLENAAGSGRFRTSKDNIHVFDNRDQTVLHTPPKAEELKERVQLLCDFANYDAESDNFFVHPIIKAIVLHFMLAYDHPFVDGNGRTARALFYWSMLRQNYWMIEFISISQIIKKSPGQYARAFLYTETDENDITYFVINQLDVIKKAVKAFYEYIDRKSREISEVEQQLFQNNKLSDKLNHRQIALIKHALKHPNMQYLIEGHRQSHHITYDTARTDLLKLAKMGLLLKRKIGKAFSFIAPTNLKNRIEK